MTTYINIFGGPGTGKSTVAAGMFYEFKKQGRSVELVTEVAKDFVWENRMKTLTMQPYVMMKQFRNLARVQGSVEYALTDSPIVLGLLYGKLNSIPLPKSYYDFLVDCHNDLLSPSINIVLQRSFAYDTTGRYQTEEHAKELDGEIINLLKQNNISYELLHPSEVHAFVESQMK